MLRAFLLPGLFLLANLTPAGAQVTGSTPRAARSPPAAPGPKACAQFPIAQNAAYAAYIKLVVDELPDPKTAGDPEQTGRDLEALYRRYVAAAQAGDRPIRTVGPTFIPAK